MRSVSIIPLAELEKKKKKGVKGTIMAFELIKVDIGIRIR